MPLPQKGDVLSGRYRIEELLGEGGMGRVYLAMDLAGNVEVAVKVVSAAPHAAAAQLSRFEREILTLKRLDHPDIVRYIDHGTHADTVYLVVELLRGRSLTEAADGFRGDAEKVLLLGARLAAAFAAAHEEGIVHRDIKPGNIHITETGDPRILDFGLARWVLPEGADPGSSMTIVSLTQTDALLGTIPYMSPEQLRAESTDRRTDIFSFAVVLYELAAGRRPYDGSSIPALLEAMDAGLPPPLRTLHPSLGTRAGTALDLILGKALEPVASDRFRTMDELATALEKALEIDSSLPRDASMAILLPPPLASAAGDPIAMVGRHAEIDTLRGALEEARSGRGSLIVVEGPAGIGKSSLVNEIARAAHRGGFLCLTPAARTPRGKSGPAAVSEEGPRMRPHEGMGPIRAWLERAKLVFPGDSAVAAALARFGPSRRTEAPDSSDRGTTPPDSVDRGEIPDAVASAIASLASRMPVLVLLEDLHTASDDSIEVLVRWVTEAPAKRLLVLATLRSDALPPPGTEAALARLLAMPGVRGLAIGPLGDAELGEMIGALYPGLEPTPALLKPLAACSGGNPFFARAVLQQLQEHGLLRKEGVDWRLAEVPELRPPPQAIALLEARIEGLEPQESAILEAAAVLGARFTAADLAQVAGIGAENIVTRLDSLGASRRIVVLDDGGYRFDQPLTASILRQRLPPDRRTALHAGAARALGSRMGESRDPGLTGAVATHLLEAGRTAEALPLAIETGIAFKERNSQENAIEWLDRSRSIIEQQIETLDESSRGPVRRQLAEIELSLGECLHAVARQTEAVDHLEKARGLAIGVGRADIQAHSLILLSQTLMDRGEVLQAQRRARDAEKLARRDGLDAVRALALSAEAYALSRSGEPETAEERWSEAVSLLDSLDKHKDAAEILLRLGNHHFRRDRFDEADDCYSNAASRVDRTQSPQLYARIQNSRAAVILAHARPAEALPLLEEAASIQRGLGARQGLAANLNNIAYCHHMLGNLEEAERIYSQVLEIRHAIGATADRAGTQRNHAEVLFDLGRIEDALAQATEALATKRQLEDLTYVPHCLNLVGEIELELGRTERAREAFGEVLREFAEVSQESYRASSGLAMADWLAGHEETAGRRFEEVAAGLTSCVEPLIELETRLRILRFLTEHDATLDRIRGILPPGIERVGTAASATPERPAREDLPKAKILSALMHSVLRAAEGAKDEARERLSEALETSRGLGFLEWTWRIHRDLARLDGEGSPRGLGELRSALSIVHGQARRFHRDELRLAYLAHRERDNLLHLEQRLRCQIEPPTVEI